MNSVKKREFTARVSQANRSELVVIMYEIILTDIIPPHDKTLKYLRSEFALWRSWLRT